MNTKNEKLNLDQLIHFSSFLLMQSELVSKRRILTIYRGDKLKGLYDKLGVDYYQGDTDLSILLSRLFMVGEKAKRFYSESFFGFSKNNLIKLSDCDESVFVNIFNQIRNSIKSKNLNTLKFFENNPSFMEYFSDKNNKGHFSNSLLSVGSEDRIQFRNYYLTLLHQLGAINYKDKSLLVSSTTSQRIAEEFAGNPTLDKSVKLHCWMPVNRRRRQFKKLGLPRHVGSPYPNQKEVSILAGILPHYILGLEILGDGKFYFNPSLFSNSISEALFLEGIDIDQEKFDEVLMQTNYEHGFVVTGNNFKEK